MKNIAVFFGGNSIEHEISVITGVLTVNSIDKRYNAVPIYVAKDGSFYTGKILKDPDCYKKLDYKKLTKVTLISGKNVLYAIKGKKLKELFAITTAINCTHGERGEDGCVSALVNTCNIALASPDILGSSVCMNKSFTKTVLKGLNLSSLPSETVSDVVSARKAERFKYPLIVKPCTGGSSIGISKVNDKRELEIAVLYALNYSEKAIIEPCLAGFTEINCACFKDSDGNLVVSECERPIGRDEVLTFSDKYNYGEREFPARIDKNLSDEIKNATKLIYKELGFKGVIRVDFFVKDDQVIVNEINTVPGSLAYYLFCENTAKFKDMLNEMIAYAETVFNRSQMIKKSYDTKILSTLRPKGSKTI